VILMSAFPAPETEKQALEAGALALLSKPFSTDELREALDRSLFRA
jgi:CheY-like chemotaxis protein